MSEHGFFPARLDTMVSDVVFAPLYLKGIRFFNRGDFFEAHDVWEELWMQCEESERLFYQGLIQAAVSLLHFENGNHIGARKLCRSSGEKLSLYGPRFQGLDILPFIEALQSHVNSSTGSEQMIRSRLTGLPIIRLHKIR